ncbi:MAG: putative DNA binding domain-containing protein [Candidatus Omnitrophica bacterium]|nr:putative DNA binding domain-containing protein [Candidatus Omnitrophota bacterium]
MNKTDLRFILQEGEGYRIEFKEALSGLDREMVAFANASGGKIFVGIADDKTVKGVRITNTLKSQIQDIANFGKKSVLRNPILADLLNRVEYIEKMGTGIRKIRDLMKQAGLSPVEFEFTSFVTAIFRRPGQIVVQKSSQKSSQKILVLIRQNSGVTIDELAASLQLTDRAIKKNLSQMKKTGLLKRIGPDKGGHWEVNA